MQSRKLFFTNMVTSPKIERAQLDGTDRMVLVSSGLGHPQALVLDKQEQKLYWADSHLSCIEMVDLDGANRQILVDQRVSLCLTSPVLESQDLFVLLMLLLFFLLLLLPLLAAAFVGIAALTVVVGAAAISETAPSFSIEHILNWNSLPIVKFTVRSLLPLSLMLTNCEDDQRQPCQ